jgi:hypothetical protein
LAELKVGTEAWTSQSLKSCPRSTLCPLRRSRPSESPRLSFVQARGSSSGIGLSLGTLSGAGSTSASLFLRRSAAVEGPPAPIHRDAWRFGCQCTAQIRCCFRLRLSGKSAVDRIERAFTRQPPSIATARPGGQVGNRWRSRTWDRPDSALSSRGVNIRQGTASIPARDGDDRLPGRRSAPFHVRVSAPGSKGEVYESDEPVWDEGRVERVR